MNYSSSMAIILIMMATIIMVNANESTTITTAKKLGSYCNPTLDGCQNETLICYNYQCLCINGFDHEKNQCKSLNCQQDQDCSKEIDPHRKCNQTTLKCNDCQHGWFFHPKRQRCVSYLGQSCLNDDVDYQLNEHELHKQSLVCRNGLYVCRPNHYPDEQWTHCKQKPEDCHSHERCHIFSDFYRICHRSKHSGRSHCICNPDSRENSHTLQCIYVGPTFSSFLMMPFFLLPMCLMIVIIAYVGHRLFRSSSSSSSTQHSSNSNRNNQQSTMASRINRRLRRNISSPSSSSTMQLDPTKSPSALNRMNQNDSPPSYDVVLREQQRIQDELLQQQQQHSQQQQVGCSTSTSSSTTIQPSSTSTTIR
ncbi:hypothetical protein DERP_013790 [Dermatophagoides pteronyssinus]|uniref:Uncharacterized protein n=1 Tax=Dermatophagoides pteronyssinus TaxID=6956 RepID=A0ABQ8JFD6_DERPT|nr:hypothetical protein DERP_013790 [Dermatophagoides pteronyssinus]